MHAEWVELNRCKRAAECRVLYYRAVSVLACITVYCYLLASACYLFATACQAATMQHLRDGPLRR